MNIIWSNEASENLFEIEEFIARDSVEQAIRFVDALIDHADKMLSNSPGSGRVVPETGNPEIRELIYRGYRIVYRLNEDFVEIVSVFEGHKLLRLNA